MFSRLVHILYPRKCPGCGKLIPHDIIVCEDCYPRFKRVQPPFCFKCGRHMENEEAEYCRECMKRERSFSFGAAAFEYDAFMKKAMSNFKFNGWKENADFFAQETVRLCGDRIARFAPTCIIPVPVHRTRRLFRGFNQAEVLAKDVGERLGIPVLSDILVRTRKTDYQKKLKKADRAANLRGAFSASIATDEQRALTRRVLILDDIFTTGSTLEACTRACLDAGAGTVGVLSVCIGRGY